MRIEFTQDGGLTAAIPGLRKPPIILDTGELAEEEAAKLARQVEAAHFFELPAHAGAPPRGAADFRHYTLTVEDGERRHTVAFDQFTPNEGLQALRRQIEGLGPP
jgi:emfourin